VLEVIIRRRRRRRIRIRRRKILCKNNSLPRRKVGRGSLKINYSLMIKLTMKNKYKMLPFLIIK
jgi:hypothetical protein